MSFLLQIIIRMVGSISRAGDSIAGSYASRFRVSSIDESFILDRDDIAHRLDRDHLNVVREEVQFQRLAPARTLRS